MNINFGTFTSDVRRAYESGAFNSNHGPTFTGQWDYIPHFEPRERPLRQVNSIPRYREPKVKDVMSWIAEGYPEITCSPRYPDWDRAMPVRNLVRCPNFRIDGLTP